MPFADPPQAGPVWKGKFVATNRTHAQFKDGLGEVQFNDPWPEVRVLLSATAEQIGSDFCATLENRTQEMREFSDDPRGELRKARMPRRKGARRGDPFAAGVITDGKGAASVHIGDAVSAVHPAAAFFWQRGARTLGAIDDLMRIDADSVCLVQSVLTAGAATIDVHPKFYVVLPPTIRELTTDETACWEILFEQSLEQFDECMEFAIDGKRYRQHFGPADILREAISAGHRLWIREVLSCAFGISTPSDAGWFCRLLTVAVANWNECHDKVNAALLDYDEQEVIRLAWPLLKAGPFSTDRITEAEARRKWNKLGIRRRQEFSDNFDDFLNHARLRSWHEFINRISSKTADRRMHPDRVEWAHFTSRVFSRVAPLLARMGLETEWKREIRSHWNLKEFLDTLAGRLFALEDWPFDAAPASRQIVHHGGRSFSIGTHESVDVTEPQKSVLLSFVGRVTQSIADIKHHSHVPWPNRELNALRKKYGGIFADAIHLPGGKGKGGYRVAVVSIAPATRQN